MRCLRILVFTILLLILIITVLIILSVRWIGYKVLFIPRKKIRKVMNKSFEDIYLKVGDKTSFPYSYKNKPTGCINVWHFSKFPNNKVILYFHGNYGNVSHRDYIIDMCEKFRVNLLLVDYRGYGNSDDKPSTIGICKDGITAYRKR